MFDNLRLPLLSNTNVLVVSQAVVSKFERLRGRAVGDRRPGERSPPSAPPQISFLLSAVHSPLARPSPRSRMLSSKLSSIPRLARVQLSAHARMASTAAAGLSHTPLYEFHVKPEHKGKMTGFAGFDMPLSYDGPVGANIAGGPGECATDALLGSPPRGFKWHLLLSCNVCGGTAWLRSFRERVLTLPGLGQLRSTTRSARHQDSSMSGTWSSLRTPYFKTTECFGGQRRKG